MSTNLDSLRSDLDSLLITGLEMSQNIITRYKKSEKTSIDQEPDDTDIQFEMQYQGWYSQAKAVIKQLLPDRLSEFEHLYMRDLPKGALDYKNFTIQLRLKGSRAATDAFSHEKSFNDLGCVSMFFQNQISILQAAKTRFTSRLYDIRQIVQADLFDSELDAARELVKKGFLRGGGAWSELSLRNI